MKKILAILITTVLCFNIAAVGAVEVVDSTDKTKAVKELILSKKELTGSYNGNKYIKIIDRFIEVNKNKEAKLVEIYNKINPLLEEGKIKNQETLNIIKYMNARVTITLVNLYENGVVDIEDIMESESAISSSDKKTIEDRIVRLQLNALDKGANLVENLTDQFEDLTNYEETGDFEMDFNLDHDSIGKFEGNLKLNDYSSKASGFDAQLEGEIEALLSAVPRGEEAVKLHIKSIVDFISKDGNMYLLLEKFNILEEEGAEEMKEFLDKAKEIATQNKYIEYSDPQTQAGLNILKSINPANIIDDSRKVLSEPLVTAYKKEGDKYLLMPTKYACDEFKKLSNKFDPFSPAKCTDSQYRELVNEITTNGTFYAEILSNSKTKIGFTGNKGLGLQKNSGYIVFDNEKILEAKYELDAGNDGEINLDYVYASKLDISLYDDAGDGAELNFISYLNNKNKFEKIDFTASMEDSREKGTASLVLRNNIIAGDFEYGSKDGKEKVSGTISGRTNSSDDLSELKVVYTGTDGEETNLNGVFSFDDSEITFENYFESKREKFQALITAEVDENHLPINARFNLSGYTKSGRYDYETRQFVYAEDFSEVFKTDITIKNKVISGSTSFSDNGEKIITIDHSGSFDTNKFKLSNKYTIGKTYSMYMDRDGGEVSGNVNFDFDTSNSKNNADIFINLFFGANEIFNFSMKNTGKRVFKDITIPTPTNTVDYKEVFDIQQNNYYY